MSSRSAVFFDRDGVINRRIVGGYVRRPDEFELLPSFGDLLQLVRSRNCLAVVITNQQGVGKGLMSLADLTRVHAHLQLLPALQPTAFDGLYSCTSLASAPGNARKPSPHMLHLALRRWNVDPAASWMIGDSATDIEAGRAAGLQTIGVHMHDAGNVSPDHRAANLSEVYDILAARLG